MILQLEISKLGPGEYQACAMDGGHEVGEPHVYSSIEEAIRHEAAGIPQEFAQYLEVQYAGVCSGTMSCEELLTKAAEVANRLVGVVAEMHHRAGW